MFNPMFIPLILLAVESSSVIALRTVQLMSGGGAAAEEVRLMVSEKVDAAFGATGSLIAGAFWRRNNSSISTPCCC
jgi:hypothetical protein